MSDYRNPVDCSLPDSSFMGFPRQEYWSGLLFPSPGDLPDPGIKPSSPALADRFFTTEPHVLVATGKQKTQEDILQNVFPAWSSY